MGWMTYFILLVLTRVSSFAIWLSFYTCIGNCISSFPAGLKLGSENLGHLGHFWWVKWKTKLCIWMCPRFLIDHMFIRKWDLHLVSKWILRLVSWKWVMHWINIGVKPAYCLKLFWSMYVMSRDFIVKTWYIGTDMWSVLLVIFRLLSRSTGVMGFQPCFPGKDLNTGQCNKLHISRQGSNNVYILIANKLAFLE